MTPARLIGLAVDTGDLPRTMSKVLTAIGLNVVVLDEAAEVRCDDGVVERLTQSRTAAPICLGFRARDLAEASSALTEHRVAWNDLSPNAIRVDRGDLVIEAVQAAPGQAPRLEAVTMFVSDIDTTATLWQALELIPEDASVDANPDDSPLVTADAVLDNVVLHARKAELGTGRTTMSHMVIRVDDPGITRSG